MAQPSAGSSRGITTEAEIVISLEAEGFGYQRPRPRSVYAWYRRHRIQRAANVPVLLLAFASRI